MRFLVDGSNVLGRFGVDRESTGEKRRLARLLARFAAGKHTVTIYFDGERPVDLGAIGGVTVRFTGNRAADERIVEDSKSTQGALTLVTSDQQLIARCRRRQLETMSPMELRRFLDAEPLQEGEKDDWEEYFSDGKNRIDF